MIKKTSRIFGCLICLAMFRSTIQDEYVQKRTLDKRDADEEDSSIELVESDIFYACKAGRDDVVKRLLRENATLVRAVKPNGDTPLHWAARAGGDGPEYGAVVLALIDAGAIIDARNDDGDTPLLEASFNDNLDRVRLLVQGGADVDAPNRYGWTPLYSAISFGNDRGPRGLDIAIYLMEEAGADVNVRGEDGYTALHMALQKLSEDDEEERAGYKRIVEILASSVDDLDATNDDGDTALHFAARLGLLEAARVLAGEGCDLDAANAARVTPILAAVRAGHARLACYLASLGADAGKEDETGTSAEEEAGRRRGGGGGGEVGEEERMAEVRRCIEENKVDRGDDGEEEEEEEEENGDEEEEGDNESGGEGKGEGEGEDGNGATEAAALRATNVLLFVSFTILALVA